MAKKRSKKDAKWSLVPKKSFDANALAKRFKKAENQSLTHAHKFIVRRWTSMGDVRRQVITWLLLIGFLMLMVGVQLSWYRSGYTTTTRSDNVVYVEGTLGPVETLNPIFSTTSAEQSLSRLIFSQPMQYDTKGRLGYDLLENLEIDEAETTYTMTLRKDAKWHDDFPVIADDLVYTINLLKDPAIKAGSSSVWNSVDVKKINEHSVELKLATPFAPLRHYLTFSVLPEHLLKDVDPVKLRENNFSNQPIGSGPFKFKFAQDGDILGASTQAMHLVRNEKYYFGAAKISRFQMLIYDKHEALLDALKNNEVNGMADLLPNQLQKIDEKRYEVRAMPTEGGVFMIFNTTAPQLKEVKMRQAIRNGVDVDKLQQNIASRHLESLYTPITAQIPDIEAPSFNPDMSMVYLDELGWRKTSAGTWKKDDQELRLKVAVIKNPELELVADEVVSQLNELGIKTDTQILDLGNTDQGALQNILQPRGFDILINRINIGADQDVYAYWHSSQATKNGLNFANYKNDIVDDALVSARSKRNPELRLAKFKVFTKRWLDDVPAVGLYRTTANYANLKSTKAFSNDVVFVSPLSRYSDVLYWSVGKQTVYKTP